MEEIKYPQENQTIQLFPLLYENDETIFFHGTNTFYSTQIEKYGFFPNQKPLADYFYHLLGIVELLLNGESELKDEKAIFDKAKTYFDKFNRISLSPVSLIAANYSIGNTTGGQALKYLRDLNYLFQKLYDPNLLRLTKQKQYFSKNLSEQLTKITQSCGVVYAVQFNKSEDLNKLSYEKHVGFNVLFCTSHIPPESIIAKMIIPKELTFCGDLITQANKYTGSLVETCPFINKIESDSN